jgi:hypothetical protein
MYFVPFVATASSTCVRARVECSTPAGTALCVPESRKLRCSEQSTSGTQRPGKQTNNLVRLVMSVMCLWVSIVTCYSCLLRNVRDVGCVPPN